MKSNWPDCLVLIVLQPWDHEASLVELQQLRSMVRVEDHCTRAPQIKGEASGVPFQVPGDCVLLRFLGIVLK